MTANNDLPAEVWSQILARLPVKTLIRLRSVNKTLRSVIDDPYFMSMHHKEYYNGSSHYDKTQLISLHIKRNNIAFNACKISLRSYDTLEETCQLFHSCDEAYYFTGNCLGLMLIKQYYPNHHLLRLWNPSIRKSIVIPPCPFENSHKHLTAYRLGFSPSTQCFKVVAFQVNTRLDYYGPMSVALYTVGDDNNLWRIITPDCGIEDVPIRGVKCGKSLYFQGAVHWITFDSSVLDSCNFDTHLMSFDFDSEKVSYVELPDATDKELGFRLEFLLGEAMAYMSVTEDKRRIWVMNKNDSGDLSWTLWFSSASTEEELLRVQDSGTIFYVDNGSTRFIIGTRSYDMATSKLRKLINLSKKDTLNLYTYMESLALCKEGKAFP